MDTAPAEFPRREPARLRRRSSGKITETTTATVDRGDKGHTRSNSQGSLKLHQARPDPSVNPAAKKRTRTRLSPTERVYEDPEVAKTAFEAERAGNPYHRRAPTPYTSRSRRRSGSLSESGKESESDDEGQKKKKGVERQVSARSLRSRVSFESRGPSRSRSRNRHGGGDSGEESDISGDEGSQRPQSTLGPWDPGFGATQGIGPAGEAIEVIGLGRKTPRHRIFRREMLKPALRSAASSRVDLTTIGSGSNNHGHNGGRARRDKPLPGRPGSIVSSVIDVIRNRPSLPPENKLRAGRNREGPPPSAFRQPGEKPPNLSPVTAKHPGSQSTIFQYQQPQQNPSHSPELSLARTRSFQAPPDAWSPLTPAQLTPISATSRDPPPPPPPPSRPSLRQLFSSFSRNLNLDDPPFRPRRSRPRPRSPVLLIPPAENLYAYLANVYIAEWRTWPSAGASDRLWAGGSGGKGKGMGWEWFRRLEVAEASRGMRGLSSWDAGEKYWEKRILDWCQQNVPVEPIDTENRWGKQIFALPSQGYDTLEFYDEKAQAAGDNGLLSWVTGSLLQTVTSVLHMLRHSASPFSFHLIPSPPPPHLPPRPHVGSTSHRSRSRTLKEDHALYEGYGTLVSVHKDNPSDRTLIMEIRPPSVVTGAVMREFVKQRREWWMLPSEVYTGDAGQANLLQSQVYDACVQNQVFFFVVTNLKYWVFGQFNTTYTSATVSPVFDRKAREPSIMQCLTTWLVRSVDERPRAIEPHPLHLPTQNHASQSAQAPPYSPTRILPSSHSRSNSYPIPSQTHYAQQGYNTVWPGQGWSSPVPSHYNPYPSPALSEFGYPNYGSMGYQGDSQGGFGYNTWSGQSGGGGTGFGHVPSPSPQGQMGGFWYGGSGGWGIR